MDSASQKFEIGIFLGVLVILAVVWAVNGYEDTWLYVIAAIIAIPAHWFYFRKKSDMRERGSRE